MALLKVSTAYSRAFLMVDSTDHITGKTGLTVTVTLSKNAGAFAAAGGSITEISSGWYKIALSTTDTNTLGDLAFHCTATGADATDICDQVVSFDTQDAVRLGLTALPNVASGSAGAIPTTGTGSNQISVSSGQVILQTGTGTGQLDFTSGVVKANATQWLSGTIPAVNVTGVPLVDLKYTLGTISPATAGSVRADAVTGAVGSVTGAVGSVTGNVGGNVVGSVASVTADVGITQAAADKAWSTATRALTDKAGFTLSAAYDLAKTAAQTGDIMKVSSGSGANQIDLSSGKVNLQNPTALKKNVALANFMFFMADSADHITPKTGLTVAATRSLDGGAFASCANSVTELSNGWYIINLAATDTNANVIAFKFSATGADQTNILAVTNA